MSKFTFILAFLIATCVVTKAQIDAPSVRDGTAGLAFKKVKALKHAQKSHYQSLDYQWHALPSPNQDDVTETSIAGDGARLVVFYRRPRPSLNLDEGIVKRWTGSSWSTEANLTNQCHYPDIDIKGANMVATWNDDNYDYGYGTNINGNWVAMTGTLLNKQWFPRATMAMDLPYMSFACMYSDGMPSNYYMLHIRSIVGTGDRIELNGGWTVTYTSVGLKTDITGDDNAWYCVFSQQEYLYVMKGSVDGGREYSDLGEGFRMYNPVSRPEIVLFNGQPVVAWLENENTELYLAEWNGSEWLLIGQASLSSGTYNTIRMASSPSELFIIYTILDSGTEMYVNSYDGSQWYEFPDAQNQAGSDITTADIAMHNNEPVIAFTEENILHVKKFSASSPTNLENQQLSSSRMRCFPNPTDGIIEVSAPESGIYTIEIKSLTGQLIHSGILSGKSKKLDLSAYRDGVYFVTLRNEEYIETRKIIRQQ